MRRIRKVKREKTVCTTIGVSLYDTLQKVRKEYRKKNGIDISNATAGRHLLTRLRPLKIPSLIIGGRNDKRKKR